MQINTKPRNNQDCPYCHDAVVGQGLTVCERCGAIMHSACFNEMGGCAATGCGQGFKNRDIKPPAPPVAAPRLTMDERIADWRRRWDIRVGQHRLLCGFDWNYMTMMGMFMGVLTAALPLFLGAYFISRGQKPSNAWLLAAFPLLGGAAAALSWRLRRL